jgi:hypothetical protein
VEIDLAELLWASWPDSSKQLSHSVTVGRPTVECDDIEITA